MIFAGTPAHLQLSQILQHLERHGKTGLLTVVQGEQKVSMYFQQGQLLCIEPQQGYVPLERRLLRAGVISLHDLQAVEFEMSTTRPGISGHAYGNEVQVALALTDLGLVSLDWLYAWARQEAIEILQEPLTWSAGKVSFEEGMQPPIDRLPLTLRIASLLPPRSGSVCPSSVSISNPEPVTEEPTPPLSASTLFKTPKLTIEGAPLPATPPAISATPLPILFKRSNPSLPETPLPQVPLTPPPLVEEHIRPALHLPQLFTSSAGLLSAARAILPLPDYDLTTKLPTTRKNRNYFQHWEVLLIVAILLITALAHGINMFHFPYYEDDEGTYISQAWAVAHLGRLAYYTYWYDHAPAGWLLIAAWTILTGGFHTFGSAINSGRVLMLLMQVGSTYILYRIARSISNSTTVAVIAALLFALSPYGIYFHRRILLDNITTFWMLLSILLLVSGRLSLKRVWLSALALSLSILSKEVTVFLIPVLTYLVFFRADKSHRWFATIGWIALVSCLLSLYPLMATLKGELFPTGTLLGGTAPHVSLLGTLQFQASRGKDGGLFDLQSEFWIYTRTWIKNDPMLVVVGSICAFLSLIAMKKQRLVGVMGAATLSLWVFLGRGGEVIGFYLVPLLPLLALSVGLILGLAFKGLKCLLTGPAGIAVTRIIQIITLGMCLFGILVGYTTSPDLGFKSNPYVLWNATQSDAQNQATQWIEKNLPLNSHMIIDEHMWTDLYNSGFTCAHYYWKVAEDPAIRDKVFHDDWRNVDYVITTIQLLSDVHNNHMDVVEEAVRHSTLIAHFDSGGWPIEVRKVNK